MRSIFIIPGLFLVFLVSCGTDEKEEKELTDKVKYLLDSVSKAAQRRTADSIKQTNPLLIVPPDSTYTGSYVDKYSNGITKFTGFFRFGQRHGQWMSFYPDGELWSEMHYDKGLRHGPNKAYFETGKLRYEGFYRNDEQDSTWTYFDSIGQVAERVVYKHNKIIQKLPIK